MGSAGGKAGGGRPPSDATDTPVPDPRCSRWTQQAMGSLQPRERTHRVACRAAKTAQTGLPPAAKQVGEELAGVLGRLQLHRRHEVDQLLVDVVAQLAALRGPTVDHLALLGALQRRREWSAPNEASSWGDGRGPPPSQLWFERGSSKRRCCGLHGTGRCPEHRRGAPCASCRPLQPPSPPGTPAAALDRTLQMVKQARTSVG